MTRLLLTALIALAALAAGCGGGDEPKIPREDAASLRSDLLEVKRRLRPLRCGDIERDFPKLESRVAELPEGSDVRDTLEDGLDHLRSLVEAECAARREQQDETTTTTEPETTTTQPPETTTQPPDTTTQPPETTTQPPETQPEPAPEPAPNPGNGGQPVPNGAVKPKKDKDKG